MLRAGTFSFAYRRIERAFTPKCKGVTQATPPVAAAFPAGMGAPALVVMAYALRRIGVTLSAASRPATIASTCAPHALSAARFSSDQEWRW
jgi:hypothetical protein